MNYAILEAIVLKLEHEASNIEQMRINVQRHLDSLEHGDWDGRGSAAFFGEMHRTIFPVIGRLHHGLSEGSIVTRQLVTIMRNEEEVAAQLYQVNGDAITSAVQQVAQAFGAFLAEISKGQASPSKQQTLIRSLKNQCMEPGVILDLIAKSTIEERQAILNDPTLMKYIQTSEGDSATVITAALMEGTLYWSGPSVPSGPNYEIGGDSDFAKWMRGEAGPPDSITGKMNCWEGFMYAAHKSGDLSEEQLRDIHQRAADAGKAAGSCNEYYEVLKQSLGAPNRTALPKGEAPPAGSMIFFEMTSPLAHVAIATGRLTPDGEVEIMSLYNRPYDGAGNQVYTMQRTTVEDMKEAMNKAKKSLSAVTYSPCAWSDVPQPAGSNP